MVECRVAFRAALFGFFRQTMPKLGKSYHGFAQICMNHWMRTQGDCLGDTDVKGKDSSYFANGELAVTH